MNVPGVSALTRFRGQAADASEQAREAAEQVQEELADRVLEFRRALADRIDPDPGPRLVRRALSRPLLRWVLLAALVMALGTLAGALAARRRAAHSAGLAEGNGQFRDPATAERPAGAAGNGLAAETR